MRSFLFRGQSQKIISVFLIAFFSGLGVHFHEHDTFNFLHFHDLSWQMIGQGLPHCLTDGHICPCFIAALDLPMVIAIYIDGLYKNILISYLVINFSLPLIWEIYHPPQTS